VWCRWLRLRGSPWWSAGPSSCVWARLLPYHQHGGKDPSRWNQDGTSDLRKQVGMEPVWNHSWALVPPRSMRVEPGWNQREVSCGTSDLRKQGLVERVEPD